MKKLDSLIKASWCLLAIFAFSSSALMAQPANDNCDGAVVQTLVIDGATTTVTGDGTGATDAIGTGITYVFEAFTIDATADVVLDLCDTETADHSNIFISLTDCPFSAVLADADSATTTVCANGEYSVYWYGLPAGTYYYPLMTDATAGGLGAYTLNMTATSAVINPAPANDAMCDAIPVMVGDTITTDNTDATADGPQAACWFDTVVENDIWFTFVAPESGAVAAETFDIGANDDTQVAIYASSDGTCSGDTLLVACNDDIDGVNYMSYVEVSGLTPGDTYFLQLDGWQGAEGEFDMVVNELTSDAMCDAFNIAVDGGPVSTGNTGATPDGPQAGCWFDSDVENDIWFWFTAPESGAVEVETFDIGENDDTQVAVYSSSDGTCTGDTAMVACNDDVDGVNYMSYALATGLTPGDVYFIQIDGWQGAEGAFDLEVSTYIPPFTCDMSMAIVCDGFEGYAAGDTIASQAAHWAPWPTFGYPSLVSDVRAADGVNSLHLTNDTNEDNLLLLGDQSQGVYDVHFAMYVPADSSAYFNVQDTEATGTWNLDVFLNEANGNPGGGTFVQDAGSTFTFPHDAWFDVHLHFDLDADVLDVMVDGMPALTGFAYTGNLGAINYYANGATNGYYVDNVLYDGTGADALTEYAENVYRVFPNPTNSIITVQGDEVIDGIVVRDVLGAAVIAVEGAYSNRMEIDLSALENGIYLLEVQVGEEISINRVMKK